MYIPAVLVVLFLREIPAIQIDQGFRVSLEVQRVQEDLLSLRLLVVQNHPELQLAQVLRVHQLVQIPQ